jgi:hypothetical protein
LKKQSTIFDWVFWACLLLAATRLLWPGDIPFIADEPELITRAHQQNAEGTWTTHGLRGTRQLDYGPVPLLVYRGLVAWFPNPVAWVVLKAFFISAIVLWSLFSFRRFFPGFPRTAWLLPFLSPYLWFYSRDLWDNSFNTAFTPALFASYLAFTRTGKKRWGFLALVCGVLAFLTHLMALPLLMATALHFICFQRSWIRRHWRAVLCGVVVTLAVSSGYLEHLLHTPRDASGFHFRLASYFFAVYGARLFSAVALEYFYGPFWFLSGGWLQNILASLAVAATAFAFLPTFWGMYQLVRPRERRPLERDLRFLCLAALLLHIALIGWNQLVSHPHYYSAIWVVFWVCYALGIRDLRSSVGWSRAEKVYLAGLATCFFGILLQLHWKHGNRQLHYGTTLSNQLELVAQEKCWEGFHTIVDERAHSNLSFREALAPYGECPGQKETGVRELRLRYRYLEDPMDGKVYWEPHK